MIEDFPVFTIILAIVIFYSLICHILVKPINFLAKTLIDDKYKYQPLISLNDKYYLTFFSPFVFFGIIFLILICAYCYVIVFICNSFTDCFKYIAFENIKDFKLSINPKDVI